MYYVLSIIPVTTLYEQSDGWGTQFRSRVSSLSELELDYMESSPGKRTIEIIGDYGLSRTKISTRSNLPTGTPRRIYIVSTSTLR